MELYPWVAAANGIIGYGNSQAEAEADWAEQYHASFSDN